MKKSKIILLALIVLVSAALTTFLIMNENAKPELLRNLPSSSYEAIEAELRTRVNTQFPEVLKEPDLIQELNSMGFVPVTIGGDSSYAVYEENAVICQNEWRILWDATEGMATNIRPMIRSSCL